MFNMYIILILLVLVMVIVSFTLVGLSDELQRITNKVNHNEDKIIARYNWINNAGYEDIIKSKIEPVAGLEISVCNGERYQFKDTIQYEVIDKGVLEPIMILLIYSGESGSNDIIGEFLYNNVISITSIGASEYVE